MSVLTTSFVAITCCNCGVDYALTDGFDALRRRDHRTFYCPNGHNQWYPGETDAQKLAKLQAAKLQVESQLEYERKSRRNAETTAKRETTRRRNLQKRVDAGVCPHCHRTVRQMADHIATKHPGCAP